MQTGRLIDKANIIRERRKNLKILINEKGELYAYCPINMPLQKVEQLLQTKQKWIQSKISSITTSNIKNKNLLNYNQTFICGEIYNIVQGDYSKILVSGNNLIVPRKYFAKNTQLNNIKKWYKQFAKELIFKRIEQLKNATKICYKSLKLCDSKVKWGSCDSNSNIKINWRIVMLPHSTIDMVLLHELVHIIEFNHSKNFYSVLEKFMPDWKNNRKILKDNNYLLMLYR